MITLVGDGGIKSIRNARDENDYEILRFIECHAHGFNLIRKSFKLILSARRMRYQFEIFSKQRFESKSTKS